MHISSLLITCFCSTICFSVIGAESSSLNQTIETCDDVILFYYQYKGYKIEDCMEDPTSPTLFWRIDQSLPWNEARSTCKASNGDLAVPKTGWHRSIVASLMAMKVQQYVLCWIGIQRQNGTLKFIDGSEIPASKWPTYTKSYSHCVNNQDCGTVLVNWYDSRGNRAYENSHYSGLFYCSSPSCNFPQPFICQKTVPKLVVA